MNYELALKLKEAGFPQHERLGIGHGDIFLNGEVGLVYNPTLPELIEACGDKIKGLQTHTKDGINGRLGFQLPVLGVLKHTLLELYSYKEWIAWSSTVSVDEAFGSTPEEAVAHLYLALNKK